MLNGLDLFSGIGGLALALAPWVRPVAYCEKDQYATSVLLSRMLDGQLPVAPIWDDIKTLRGVGLPQVDIVYGGPPCQDFSVAGTGAGLGGSRGSLMFEFLRVAGECNARFVFLENVPALAVRGLERVLLGFNELGHDARWTIVSAFEVGAPHLRRRLWVLSNAARIGCGKDGLESNEERAGLWPSGSEGITADSYRGGRGNESKCIRGISDQSQSRLSREEANAPDAASSRLEGGGEGLPRFSRWGEVEPAICGSNHGVSNRMERIKCLGNAVVPHAAREAFRRLIGL